MTLRYINVTVYSCCMERLPFVSDRKPQTGLNEGEVQWPH